MSRAVQTYSVGKERTHLCKAIVISIRELMKQSEPNQSSKDLAAFISIALVAVDATVERTVAPWEKRDYWVKADKFRRDWAWAKPMGEKMRVAVIAENWSDVAAISLEIGTNLKQFQVSERHRMGKPWVGAWQKLFDSEGNIP